MNVTKTARQKLRNYTRYLDYTLSIYRSALEYVCCVIEAEWHCIESLDTGNKKINYVENLIHDTADNEAAYPEFDAQFYKFPSYLRRAVIAEAIGNVSSHMTRLGKWESKPKGKPPTFNPKCNSFPVFYKDNMCQWVRNGKVRLKLYNGSDWIWFTLPFEPFNRNRFPESEGWERQNPMLVKKGRRWALHFPFLRKIKLQDKDFTRPVLSVDLGLTTTATVSVMSSDGTVLHRSFLDYGREKDHLKATIGRIAVKSAQTYLIPEDQQFCHGLWNVVNHLTDEIAHKCSGELVALAKKYGCQAIVFEHLGKLKVPKGFYGAARLRRKFHYWLQGRIQKFTRYKAHAEEIRISKVLARGTSENAFDSSGKVRRIGNRQIALFRSGKFYNCDLSASYNIGARYWIREILGYSKSLTGNGEVGKRGRMPESLPARHEQCLASLISLVRSGSYGIVTAPALYSRQVLSPSGDTPTIAAA